MTPFRAPASARARAWTATPGVRWRLGAVALLVGALVVVAVTVRLPDLAHVQAWIATLGPAAPAAFALAYALAVPAPLPKSVLNTAAGVAFGIPLGASVVIVGTTAGATLSFLIARWLGRDVVASWTGGRIERVDALVARRGLLAALAVRWVPVLPFTVLNYACGVTSMRLRHYALGTAVGVIPGSTAWVALGSLGGNVSPWLPVGISVGLAIATLLAGAGAGWWRLAATDSHGNQISPTFPPPQSIEHSE